MPALASIADYEDITGRSVADVDEARVTRLLNLASDAVLAGAHGQLIAASSTTNLACEPYDGVIYLPQRPVTAVTAVTVDGDTLDPSAYRWEPGGNGRPARLIRRRDDRDSVWTCTDVLVSYEHGWDPVPGQIISAVVVMAARVADNGTDPVVTQSSTGPASDSYAPWDAQSPTMQLSGPTRSVLDQLCKVRRVASIRVPADAR